MFDFWISLLGLILLSPLFLLIGILIKIDSKGPVFFCQERVGKDGKLFQVYKFRTLIDSAVSIGLGLNIAKDDPRITRVPRGDLRQRCVHGAALRQDRVSVRAGRKACVPLSIGKD